MHNYTASFRDKVYVDETFEGDRVWRGSLYVFDLVGHPKATKCYAGRRQLRDQTLELQCCIYHKLNCELSPFGGGVFAGIFHSVFPLVCSRDTKGHPVEARILWIHNSHREDANSILHRFERDLYAIDKIPQFSSKLLGSHEFLSKAAAEPREKTVNERKLRPHIER